MSSRILYCHDFMYYFFDKATGGAGREQILLFLNIFLIVEIFFFVISLIGINPIQLSVLLSLLFLVFIYLVFYLHRYLVYLKSEKIINRFSKLKISRFIAIFGVIIYSIIIVYFFFYTTISLGRIIENSSSTG
jgi:hypothetical protein